MCPFPGYLHPVPQDSPRVSKQYNQNGSYQKSWVSDVCGEISPSMGSGREWNSRQRESHTVCHLEHRGLSWPHPQRPKSVWQILVAKDRPSQTYGTRADIGWVPPPRSAMRTHKCLHQAEVGSRVHWRTWSSQVTPVTSCKSQLSFHWMLAERSLHPEGQLLTAMPWTPDLKST